MGPMEDGTIPTEQVNVLKELGAWNKKNGEAVFNTVAGIPQGHFYGATTLSKDSTVLYLFLQGKISGDITLKGLKNKIEDFKSKMKAVLKGIPDAERVNLGLSTIDPPASAEHFFQQIGSPCNRIFTNFLFFQSNFMKYTR